MTLPPRADGALAGWVAATAIGYAAESVAALPVPEPRARAALRDFAAAITRGVTLQEQKSARPFVGEPLATPPLLTSMRANVARRSASAFTDFARDAAAAFGDRDAARSMDAPLAAVIEGIKIIDDIQDEEAHCLATEVGAARALNVAMGALAYALELTAALPLADASWRAATAAIGRGIRETAIGQELEQAAIGDFESFWHVVDRKTPPLVATALELGALAASAEPARAAALTRLAVPLGRLLQISDDCNDALGPQAPDWRKPHLNLLLLFALTGPHREELTRLMQNLGDVDSLRAAQIWLLQDGALAYAMHAQLTTLQTLADTIESLALLDPAPFVQSLERQRADTEALLRKTGVMATAT